MRFGRPPILALAAVVAIAAVAALAGCGVPPLAPIVAIGAGEAASVAVFGRDIGDLVYSGVTGRDCSIVRLEQGKTYCRPPEPPLVDQPICTRSLGFVDCWSSAAVAPPHSHEVADGPAKLTPEQERDAEHHWPAF